MNFEKVQKILKKYDGMTLSLKQVQYSNLSTKFLKNTSQRLFVLMRDKTFQKNLHQER
jgi:hypothetical protein